MVFWVASYPFQHILHLCACLHVHVGGNEDLPQKLVIFSALSRNVSFSLNPLNILPNRGLLPGSPTVPLGRTSQLAVLGLGPAVA